MCCVRQMHFLISPGSRQRHLHDYSGLKNTGKPSYVRMEGPLREAEALLLSTAWFSDIYLDISGGLGTLSTVFSSVHHRFSGLWGSELCWPAQIHLSACIMFSKIHNVVQLVDRSSNFTVSRHSFRANSAF